MKPFKQAESNVAALDVPNVDTDQIIPKQFLKRVERTGFGQFLFYDWRFTNGGKKENADFSLNKPAAKGAKILLARDNFGCGSSREHAPWALLDYGFEVIIAPSYADIFYNNCFQNGILPIQLESEKVDELFAAVEADEKIKLKVNLEKQKITGGSIDMAFEIDENRKNKLLNGLDDISWSLQFEAAIKRFETQQTIY